MKYPFFKRSGKTFFHLFFFFAILTLCFSCTSYKQVPYFQDLNRDSSITEKITNFTPITIQPGDLLGINVNSLNHEADLQFNYNSTERQVNTDRNVVVGQLVDYNGNISIPLVGDVHVTGLTTGEVAALLEKELVTYLSKPIVNVRLFNFKISVLGDVSRPGSFNINDEKITITQALSLAGDLNTTALRKNLLLIREVNGTRKYVNIDLTSKNFISSPYYYLKNNDVIYAQPNEARVQNDAGSITKLGLLISAFSSIFYGIALYLTRN